jgi:hypothetical protein
MEGLIYKLYVPGLDELCYVGSTTMMLKERLVYHQNAAKYDSQTKARSHLLFSEGNEPVIECLEEGTYASKEELLARERYWIGRFPECLNHNIPGRTWQERWALNREHNLATHREWLKNNQEHTRAYLEANRNKIREQEKARNAAGYKDVRNAKKKEKVECPVCKKVMNKGSLWTHTNTVHKTPL